MEGLEIRGPSVQLRAKLAQGFSRETSVTVSVNRPEHTEPVEEEAVIEMDTRERERTTKLAVRL